MKAAPVRGLLAALLLTAGAVAAHREAHAALLTTYGQYNLPGFDAHVYMAMADAPGIFTLPPWGWRVLTPALVHVLPLPTALGFVWTSQVFLVVSGGLLFLFLRRLGCGPIASALGVAAFAFGPTVEASVSNPFLVEPLTLALLLALLVALEAGLGAGPLALILTLGALSKEVFVLLLPTLFFARRDRDGGPRAFVTMLVAAAPALVATLLLRGVWAPARAAPLLANSDAFWLATWKLLENAPLWLPVACLSGLTPLALLAWLRPAGRLLIRRYAYFLGVTAGLPFAAAVYTGDPSAPFFLDDIPRLLIFAAPLVVAFALVTLDGVVLHLGPPPARAAIGNGGALACGALALVVAVLPLVALDEYRRADLSGPRDGRFVLAFCRESLAEAGRLAAGRQVDLEPERRSFVPRKTFPELMGRMRWFLRKGFGPGAPYGIGAVVAAEPAAALTLPCLRPEDIHLVLTLQAPRDRLVRVAVNGYTIAELRVGPKPDRFRVLAPGGALFRGDNELSVSSPEAGLRLVGLRMRAARD